MPCQTFSAALNLRGINVNFVDEIWGGGQRVLGLSPIGHLDTAGSLSRSSPFSRTKYLQNAIFISGIDSCSSRPLK